MKSSLPLLHNHLFNIKPILVLQLILHRQEPALSHGVQILLPGLQADEGPRLDPPLEGLKNDKSQGIERNDNEAANKGALEEGVPTFTGDKRGETATRVFVFTWRDLRIVGWGMDEGGEQRHIS